MGLQTRIAIARLPLRQLGFRVNVSSQSICDYGIITGIMSEVS